MCLLIGISVSADPLTYGSGDLRPERINSIALQCLLDPWRRRRLEEKRGIGRQNYSIAGYSEGRGNIVVGRFFAHAKELGPFGYRNKGAAMCFIAKGSDRLRHQNNRHAASFGVPQ